MEITVEKVDTGVQKLGFQALSTLKTVRVAVYARVSTDQEIQLHSLEEQMKAFRAKIAQHPGWMLVDVYADEGISGTSVKKRKEFLRMMEDCEAGKVDYIMAKSISRFARNTVECLSYVELLLNSVNRCIAVRPCDGNNPNAIHWGKLREGRWCALSKSCRGLAKTLFDIMDWDQDLKYRFRGDFIENDDQKVMLFQLDEPEMVKTENIVLPPKEAETDDRAEIAGRTIKQIIYILPPEWEDTFGRPITSIGEINLLEQRHYAADWDVLRPAKELAEYSTLTSEDLEELLHEAEKIIEGWPIPDEHGAGESADNGDGESAGVGTECGADVGAGTEENGDRADL